MAPSPDFTEQPVEITGIAASDARTDACPKCGAPVFTPAQTRFIAACQISETRVAAVCDKCADSDAPALVATVECLNRLARCMPALEWRHAARCIGGLQLLAQETVDSAPPEEVQKTTGGQPEVRRAVVAMIARQCLDVGDISVRDTVGTVDPWSVIEALSGLIADWIKHSTDNVEGWVQSTFLEIAADEDAE